MSRVMKRIVGLVIVAACGGGVSSDPKAAWDETVAAFASAHCTWNDTCNQTKAGCLNETTQILTTSKPEVDAARCIACMDAWIDAYTADTTPVCKAVLTSQQYSD